ncbi:MAG: FAD-dependent oxidoreductase [Deltaproteobacteria bacterium]|nr:FAD-dependent oxidoreductase [Deltaproteobacteria bacterium]
MSGSGSIAAGATTGMADALRVTYEAVVEQIIEHDRTTRSLWLRLPADRPLRFVPGQFISLQLPAGGQTLTRAYSIASDPETADCLELCLDLVPDGLGSQYLFSLPLGARIHFTGPWGAFTLSAPPAAEVVFLADATGIVPIRPMLRRVLRAEPGFPVRLHHRAPAAAGHLYSDEWQGWQRTCPRFEFDALSADSASALLALTRDRYVNGDGDRSRHFYVCGVGDIVTELRDLLRGAGYARRAVQYEKW